MSVKEKLLRRLLIDAEFYLNNIDGDDPYDPVGDARRGGSGSHPVNTFVKGILIFQDLSSNSNFTLNNIQIL